MRDDIDERYYEGQNYGFDEAHEAIVTFSIDYSKSEIETETKSYASDIWDFMEQEQLIVEDIVTQEMYELGDDNAQGGGGMGFGDVFETGIGAAGTYFSVKGKALHNELYWKGKTTGKIYTTGKYGTTNHLNMRGGYANSYKVVGKPLQAAKSLGTKLGIAGLLWTGYDIVRGDGPTTSKVLDLTFGAAGFIPGIGWMISGSYFLINTGVQLYSGKSIGEH